MPVQELSESEKEEPMQPKWKKIHFDQSDGDEHIAVIKSCKMKYEKHLPRFGPDRARILSYDQ